MNPAAPRRFLLRAAALLPLVALGWSTTAHAQSSAPKPHRVVIQVTDNDPARWNLALNNTRNAQEDLGAANVEIEIVAYGPGINMLKSDSVVGSRIDEALKAGVKVVACQNTMRAFKLTAQDMLPAIGYVPAGVTEIMKKQGEGWAYLRP
jgi:intracellular sulfur oxidation DsrE/DsrF family protein